MAEFKVFVESTEQELRQLFDRIDRNKNGILDKDELRAAFRRAGLAISKAKLQQFFDEVDVNDDGVITFEEWRYDKKRFRRPCLREAFKPNKYSRRDFLLFIPAGTPNLRAVLSYYSSVATVNLEGDVIINDSLQGFGNFSLLHSHYLYHLFFLSYLCSSSALLAMAFLAFATLPPSQPALDGKESVDDMIPRWRYSFGKHHSLPLNVCSVPQF